MSIMLEGTIINLEAARCDVQSFRIIILHPLAHDKCTNKHVKLIAFT